MQPIRLSIAVPEMKLWLCDMRDAKDDSATIDRIVECCNETEIYDRLFRERLNSRPYTAQDAIDWCNWAAEGWERNTHFCFIVRNFENLPVASCDLKTASRIDDEIGYWRSQGIRRTMTDIVSVMLDWAKLNGFKSFFARIEEDNTSSQRVVERLGFELSSEIHESGMATFRLKGQNIE